MRTNCCHGFLAFNLKFFNFLQFFVGISMVARALYLLSHWHNHAPVAPPPSIAPSPDSADFRFYSYEGMAISGRIGHFYLADEMVSGSDELPGLSFSDLPAPWFIYCFMAVGVMLSSISCIGHIAAESINGCCLCFYTLLMSTILFLEGSMVAIIALYHSWEKALPFDPTGELETLKDFIEKNADLCKWVGIALLAVQALSLLLAFLLRTMVTTQRTNSDVEDNYADPRDGRREPLLNKLPSQASGSVKGEVRANLSEIWSSRIREKYGLRNASSKYMAN